jgi:hypothetical protein
MLARFALVCSFLIEALNLSKDNSEIVNFKESKLFTVKMHKSPRNKNRFCEMEDNVCGGNGCKIQRGIKHLFAL